VVTVILIAVLYSVMAVLQNLSPYFVPQEAELGRSPMGIEAAKMVLLLDRVLDQRGKLAEIGATMLAQPGGHPADRLVVAITLGEAQGGPAALERLEEIRDSSDWATIETPEGVREDLEAVADAEAIETLYSAGVEALSDAQRSRLESRYGWLGELALTHGEPEGSPERAALYEDAPWALLLVLFASSVFLVGVLGGLTMGIVAAVWYFTRRLPRRFVPTTPSGGEYLETFGVFLVGFTLLQIGAMVVAKLVGPAEWLELSMLFAQWVLLPAIFWPLTRGVRWREWREAVGWRAPRGVLREVLAGIGGYLAGVPLFYGSVVIATLMMLLSSHFLGEWSVPQTNRQVERLTGGFPGLVLFAILAMVWAPLVEETVFRGSLYRHLRSRRGVLFSAVLTAFLFGFLHPVGPLLVLPLMTLGFTFALIREWRGSLIAPIAAHCLHNSTVVVLTLLALRALG
jgi:membrane protease YdiL (CAAX protease family)